MEDPETQIDRFLAFGHMLPQVTGKSVSAALAGFELKLRTDRDMDWLALASRRALAVIAPNFTDGPDRPGNKDIRDELTRMAQLSDEMWKRAFFRGWRVNHALWEHSVGLEIAARLPSEQVESIDEPEAYRRFSAAVNDLQWLSGFLRAAAGRLDDQSPNWRIAQSRDTRISQGTYLAPIFESAFGRPITVNNYPNSHNGKPTPFMDFYQRMIALAYGESRTPNLSAVLKQAQRLHREDPVRFAESIIPGL